MHACCCFGTTFWHSALTLGSCLFDREVTHDTAAVLHFTFNRFADLKARRDRCDCAPTEADAKRCFILPFDRMVGLTLT